MELGMFLLVALLAFILQFVDSSVGMGYGSMTPILLLLGFEPLAVVPAVLAASAGLSLLTGGLHQAFRNINISSGTTLRVTLLLLGFGILGMVGGVSLADSIPGQILSIYIGLIGILIGVVLLFLDRETPLVSWPRLAGFGAIAAFNKGMTGGGFGPVLAGGQIVSGVEEHEAVGVTALTEGLLSALGVITYLVIDPAIAFDLGLLSAMLLGGVVSSPIAAYTVSQVRTDFLRLAVAGASILLGVAVIARAVL